TPFLYFADHDGDLAAAVREGRRQFLSQFPSLRQAELAAPEEEATWRRCILDWEERERNEEAYRLHRDLIHLRRSDPVLSRAHARRPEGAVLGGSAFLLRYLDASSGDRLLLVNLGRELNYAP